MAKIFIGIGIHGTAYTGSRVMHHATRSVTRFIERNCFLQLT